jgi:hypothetical protein
MKNTQNLSTRAVGVAASLMRGDKRNENKLFDESTVIGKATHLTLGRQGTNPEKDGYFASIIVNSKR